MKIRNVLCLFVGLIMSVVLFSFPISVGAEESDRIYLSDLPMKSYSWLHGSMTEDGTTTGRAPTVDKTEGAGNKITIAGVQYDKGLCYHPGSACDEIVYDISGLGYSRFTAIVGKDLEATANGGAVEFFVVLDGEIVAQSGNLFFGESYTFDIDITGKSTIALRINDGMDGIAWDTSSWANPILSNGTGALEKVDFQTQPKIVYKKGESFETYGAKLRCTYDNGLEKYVPLSNDMVKNFNSETLGEQIINVEVEPGFALELKIYIAEEISYLSDMEWESYAVYGGGTPFKDINEIGNKISVAGITFDKGLRVHPISDAEPAEIRYNIKDMGYNIFTAYVGKDAEASSAVDCTGSKIQFELLGDGQVIGQSPVLVYGEGYYMNVDITGISELVLRVNSVDGIFCDASSWGDVRLTKLVVQQATPEATPVATPVVTPVVTPETTVVPEKPNNPETDDFSKVIILAICIAISSVALVRVGTKSKDYVKEN